MKRFITVVLAGITVLSMSVFAVSAASGNSVSGNSVSGNSIVITETPQTEAVYVPVNQAEEAAKAQAEEIAKATEQTILKEVALPVSSFTSTAAVNAIPAAAKTETTGTVYNLSSITTTTGFVTAVHKIVNSSAAAGSTEICIYTEKPFPLNAASVSAVTNSNKPFVYTFSYKGHMYRVRIPAGSTITYGKSLFVGPLEIGRQLGTTEVLN